MYDQRIWRGLGFTYAIVAIVQLYLAQSTGATWAVLLAVLWLLAALGCTLFAHGQGRRKRDEDVDLGELAKDALRSDHEELAQWVARQG